MQVSKLQNIVEQNFPFMPSWKNCARKKENDIRLTIISSGALLTELYKIPAFVELVENTPADIDLDLKSSDNADAVAYAISTPETVTVSEILIRPTKQIT